MCCDCSESGQKTGPEQMKGDCEVLLTFYSIFLDVNYDSNNMLLVGKKKKKKKQFLASCGGGSEEVLNYILSWKYTSCHLSLDVRVFHLAWKFRLIGNLFLKKKKIICQALWCVVHIFVLESQEAQTITEKCKLNFPSYSLTLEWC